MLFELFFYFVTVQTKNKQWFSTTDDETHVRKETTKMRMQRAVRTATKFQLRLSDMDIVFHLVKPKS